MQRNLRTINCFCNSLSQDHLFLSKERAEIPPQLCKAVANSQGQFWKAISIAHIENVGSYSVYIG